MRVNRGQRLDNVPHAIGSFAQPQQRFGSFRATNLDSPPQQGQGGIADVEPRDPQDLDFLINQTDVHEGQAAPYRTVQSGDTDLSAD